MRWEDALVSANGAMGIMVLGRPFDELIVVNHEKCWMPTTNVALEPAELAEAWREARQIADERRYRDADLMAVDRVRAWCAERFGDAAEVAGVRLAYERIHPAFHLHIDGVSMGSIERYQRVMDLETGEGKQAGDFESVQIGHDGAELCLYAVYGRTLGRPEREGFGALGRVVADEGRLSRASGWTCAARGSRRCT
jgi:hypothetical protein